MNICKCKELLTVKDIENSINSEDKDALTKLFHSKYQEAVKANIKVKGFYYDYYVACSSEIFDMFCLSGLKSLLEIAGYSVTEYEVGKYEDDLPYGKVTVSKGDFSFEMDWVDAMHDSLISYFVDAKTAKILRK